MDLGGGKPYFYLIHHLLTAPVFYSSKDFSPPLCAILITILLGYIFYFPFSFIVPFQCYIFTWSIRCYKVFHYTMLDYHCLFHMPSIILTSYLPLHTNFFTSSVFIFFLSEKSRIKTAWNDKGNNIIFRY